MSLLRYNRKTFRQDGLKRLNGRVNGFALVNDAVEIQVCSLPDSIVGFEELDRKVHGLLGSRKEYVWCRMVQNSGSAFNGAENIARRVKSIYVTASMVCMMIL